MKKLTKEEFIVKARKIHGDKYDYSKVIYVNSSVKIEIICPIHGSFYMTPNAHLMGQGCPKCGHTNKGQFRKLTKESFVEKSNKIHNNKFDYSKVEYVNGSTKVCIICPEHGEFWQKPNAHLNGNGCPKCCINGVKRTKEEFVELAKSIHGKKFNYDDVVYVNSKTKVKIKCNKCGKTFLQTPHDHLSGYGCPFCVGRNKTTEDFINEARLIHGDKYTYENVVYVIGHDKICITCPKHGEFWQTPSAHLSGQGCPICKTSKLEKEVAKYLKESSVKFVSQKRFDWLGRQSLDFFLPQYYVAIECQGKQHFKHDCNFGSSREISLENIQELDEKKKKLCEEHGIKMFYYSNLKIDYPYKVYEKLDTLLFDIKNI